MSNYYEIEIKDQNGFVKRKIKIKKLEEPVGDEFEKIGKAKGVSIEHCFYLTQKFADNFKERVYGYTIEHVWGDLHNKDGVEEVVQDKTDSNIEICFYETN